MSRIALAVVGFLLSATAAAQALEVPIVFLSRKEEPKLSLSYVDPIVKDPAVWGARLAINDNNTTGQFLNQKYKLIEVSVPKDGDVAAAFAKQVQDGNHLFVSDLDRKDLLAIAHAPDSKDTLIFDDRTRDDDLRTETCFAQVFHTAASRSMLTDALVEFLVWKRWPNIYLLSGTQAADKAYAAAFRRSAKKFGAKIVTEGTYAYSPIARVTDSGSVQVQKQMPIITQEGGD
ncbi:MAG: ABC transporter substrate-binding protein, partial [Pararhizobium sp.]